VGSPSLWWGPDPHARPLDPPARHQLNQTLREHQRNPARPFTSRPTWPGSAGELRSPHSPRPAPRPGLLRGEPGPRDLRGASAHSHTPRRWASGPRAGGGDPGRGRPPARRLLPQPLLTRNGRAVRRAEPSAAEPSAAEPNRTRPNRADQT